MIAGEGLAFQDDLVAAVLVGFVERRHEKMQIRRQGLHDGDLGLMCSHDGGHEPGRPGIDIQPRRKRGVAEGFEVALDALGAPSVEKLADPGGRTLGLQAERVAAEVSAWRIVVACL